jgi:hypothetical protein
MLLVWMSRSAIPARFSAARTRSIRAAFCWIAPLAVAERGHHAGGDDRDVGHAVTSPVALMSSRVPAIVW